MIKENMSPTLDPQAEVDFLKEQLSTLTIYTTNLEEQLSWFKKQLFGSRSERTLLDLGHTQPLLPGFSMPDNQSQSKEEQEVKSHVRKKRKSTGENKLSFIVLNPYSVFLIN